MYFYNIVFISLIVLGFFSATYDVETRMLKIWSAGNVLLPLTFLCVIQGIRGLRVGNDTYKYAKFFLHADSPGGFRYSRGKDPLYYLWCRILNSLTSNTVIFNFCCAIFICILLGFFIYTYSTDKLISVLLFLTLGLFFASMNQTRQTMAVVVILYAFHYAVERNVVVSMSLCFAAVMIHTTAIVFAPIFLFIAVFPVLSEKVIALFTVASGLIVVFFNSFMNLFVWIFPSYKKYLTGYLFRTRAVTIWRYGDFCLFVIVQIGLILGIRQLKIVQKANTAVVAFDEKHIRCANIYACINAIGMSISYISMKMAAMERIKQYFMYWMIICIPFVICTFVKRKRITGLLVATISLMYMWHIGVRDGHGVIPYRTVFENLNTWLKFIEDTINRT